MEVEFIFNTGKNQRRTESYISPMEVPLSHCDGKFTREGLDYLKFPDEKKIIAVVYTSSVGKRIVPASNFAELDYEMQMELANFFGSLESASRTFGVRLRKLEDGSFLGIFADDRRH